MPWVITGLQLDNTSDLVIAGGIIKISSMYRGSSNQPPASLNPIHITGGNTTISDFHLLQNGVLPTIGMSGGRLMLAGGYIGMANGVTSVVNQSAGIFMMFHCYINAPATVTGPIVSQTNGVIIMNGNMMHGGTSGVAVSVATDLADNTVTNNDFQQYTVTLPAGTLLGIYQTGPLTWPTAALPTA